MLIQSPIWSFVLAALLGLILGSFFNVVIARLPRMMELQWQRESAEAAGHPVPATEPFNLAVPRSHCPSCKATVAGYDNIPVLSWLLLRGRCRHCKTPISALYPLVEIVSALIPVFCLAFFGINSLALAYSLLLWFLLVLSVIDLKQMLLPDQLTLPLLWLGLLGSITVLPLSAQDAIIGAVAGYLFLWALYWLFKLLTGKEGMGYGDFKLLAALGAWLGWQQLPLILLLASAAGAVIGGTLLLMKKHQQGIPIPFGPFLVIGAVIALLFGEQIYLWYWQWAGLV
ncbi:prepilin peptidase [Aliidiomarina minuta]|uniref:Prepilin leader peptidase/N-methyltransferase n=1 Tax=Aliidiomarina minuta TaxID=880057 RepID=A0A432WAX5_9GAMM|nr:prepilin peptidase [Aliidiomarina minuta]